MNMKIIAMEPMQAFDAKTAAAHLGVQPITLCKWRLNGSGPLYRKLGRRVVYLRKDLDAFLEAAARRSTSDRGGKAA